LDVVRCAWVGFRFRGHTRPAMQSTPLGVGQTLQESTWAVGLCVSWESVGLWPVRSVKITQSVEFVQRKQPMPVCSHQCHGWQVLGTILHARSSHHSVYISRRASGPEGCGRRIAKLGESERISGIVPGSTRWQTFAYLLPLPAQAFYCTCVRDVTRWLSASCLW